MASAALRIPQREVATFCQRHCIRKLALFGSALGPNFGPQSDVDVLVWFERGRVPGMFALVTMEQELSDIIGREVDLRTPEDLSCLFRDDVVANAEVQYAG